MANGNEQGVVCYKVVLSHKYPSRQVLESIVAPKPATVFYKLGECVEAPRWLAKRGYGLLAFSTEEDAKCFQFSTAEGSSIYLAEGFGEIALMPAFCDIGYLVSRKMIADAWMDWPEGTRMFRAIKLELKV